MEDGKNRGCGGRDSIKAIGTLSLQRHFIQVLWLGICSKESEKLRAFFLGNLLKVVRETHSVPPFSRILAHTVAGAHLFNAIVEESEANILIIV